MAESLHSRADAWLSDRLAGFAERCARRPRLVLLAALALTLLSLGYCAGHLGVNGDNDQLFDASLPFRQRRIDFERSFPLLQNRVLVVVDAASDTRARDAARRLAEALEAEPAHFASVFVPGDGPFFERHGLLYLELGELEELVDRLAVAQPFLAELSRDRSLRGFFGLLSRALDEAAQGEGLDLSRTFVLVQQAAQAASRLRARPVGLDELVFRRGDAVEPARRYVVLQPVQDLAAFVPAEAAMTRLHEIVEDLERDRSAGVRLGVTGDVALEYEELESVKSQAGASLGLSFVLVVALLFLALRSSWLVLGTQLTLVFGLIWTAGFAALAIGHLNVISVAFAVMFVGLGVDFAIHFCLRFAELRRRERPHFAALRETGRSTGASLLLCAATTALGFYAFTPTGYAGVAELGLIAGTGMFVSLLATLSVLPAWLSLTARRRERVPAQGLSFGLALPRLAERRARAVLVCMALLAAAAAALATRWHFDPNPLHVRDPGTESVRTFEALLAAGDLNPWTAELIAPDLAAAEAEAARLRELPEVDRAATLASYVPEDQPDKLAVLADAALLLHLGEPGERLPPPSPAEELAALRRFRGALAGWSARAGEAAPPAAAALAGDLDRFLARAETGDDGEQAVAQLRESLVSPTLARLDELALALTAGPVGPDDLPAEIRERMIAADGRARVEVFPKGDLNDSQTLVAFTDAVRGVAPDATGVSVYMVDSARLILRSLLQAFAYALAAMTLLLLLLWRNLADTLRTLAPLAVAAAATAAGGVLLGIPINFADVIVLPLLLGIGIDTGIHLVHRFRTGGESELADTSTSRGVVWSAATTIASFGTLGLASHRGLASLGQLLALGVLVTLLANLLLVPALLALGRARERAGAVTPAGEER